MSKYLVNLVFILIFEGRSSDKHYTVEKYKSKLDIPVAWGYIYKD